MKIKLSGFIIASAILLGGCQSTGGEDKFSGSYVQSHLVKGKTTVWRS